MPWVKQWLFWPLQPLFNKIIMLNIFAVTNLHGLKVKIKIYKLITMYIVLHIRFSITKTNVALYFYHLGYLEKELNEKFVVKRVFPKKKKNRVFSPPGFAILPTFNFYVSRYWTLYGIERKNYVSSLQILCNRLFTRGMILLTCYPFTMNYISLFLFFLKE